MLEDECLMYHTLESFTNENMKVTPHNNYILLSNIRMILAESKAKLAIACML